MTTQTSTSPPVASAVELTDGERRTLLTTLAGEAEDQPYGIVQIKLGLWAHPSLSPGRRAELLEDYRDLRMRAAALLDGGATWDGENPDLRCADRAEQAAWGLEDRASEALYQLVHGTGEK